MHIKFMIASLGLSGVTISTNVTCFIARNLVKHRSLELAA